MSVASVPYHSTFPGRRIYPPWQTGKNLTGFFSGTVGPEIAQIMFQAFGELMDYWSGGKRSATGRREWDGSF
jgi:hypothetical protein